MTKLAVLTVVALLSVSGSAMAADLYVPPRVAPVVVAVPESSWDGSYIGVFAGYGWGALDASNITAAPSGGGAPQVVSTSVPTDGFQLGLQGGYNFHLSGNVVAGVSGDIAYDNGTGSATIPNTVDVDLATKMNWTGSVTARLGVDTGTVVPYVLGGIAFANGTGTVVDGGVSGASQTQTFTGYTVGAGVEVALADNVSADVEYRYANYGSQNFPDLGVLTVPAGALSSNSVRAGLNYHF